MGNRFANPWILHGCNANTLMPTATIDDIIARGQHSAGDVTGWASSIVGASRGKQSEKELQLSGQSLTSLQQQQNNTRRDVGTLADIVNNISGLTIADIVTAGFRRSWTSQTQLVAGVNNITFADPNDAGDTLAIWVRQVASGTVGTVTFGSNIKFCDVNYVTNTVNKVTIWKTEAFVDPTDSVLRWFGVSPANAEQTL